VVTTARKKAVVTKARTTTKKAVRAGAPTTKRVTRSTTSSPQSRPKARRKGSTSGGGSSGSSADAIALLKDDHRQVEKLFKAFEKTGEKAYRTKAKLVGSIIAELSVHAAIEEQFFYPAVRSQVPAANDDVLEALEEHHVAKWILSELTHMGPESERFDAKVTVLIESVRHHVREEEHELFPEVRSAMSRADLVALGGQLREGKRIAPTRPHPRSPDEPPGNLLVGAVAGVVDRARTAVTSK
jgi:hemerythrin-like domain-containing protein